MIIMSYRNYLTLGALSEKRSNDIYCIKFKGSIVLCKAWSISEVGFETIWDVSLEIFRL